MRNDLLGFACWDRVVNGGKNSNMYDSVFPTIAKTNTTTANTIDIEKNQRETAQRLRKKVFSGKETSANNKKVNQPTNFNIYTIDKINEIAPNEIANKVLAEISATNQSIDINEFAGKNGMTASQIIGKCFKLVSNGYLVKEDNYYYIP